MQIGELARRCGVNIDTTRYYERQDLLPKPDRLASGYRRYLTPDIARLQFVRCAMTLGFMLDEIKELFALTDHREQDIGELKAIAAAKRAESIAVLRTCPESAMA